MSIPFRQYLRPHGTPTEVTIDRPADVEAKARAVIASGLRFEGEVLTTGQVSLTVFDPEAVEDVAITIVPNGPQVPEAVDMLVEEAWSLVSARSAP